MTLYHRDVKAFIEVSKKLFVNPDELKCRLAGDHFVLYLVILKIQNLKEDD